MALLIAGLVLFFGIHLVPTVPALRARLVDASGEERYRLIFALLAALGLALIVFVRIARMRGGIS